MIIINAPAVIKHATRPAVNCARSLTFPAREESRGFVNLVNINAPTPRCQSGQVDMASAVLSESELIINN